jgi:hypothetical protein
MKRHGSVHRRFYQTERKKSVKMYSSRFKAERLLDEKLQMCDVE